MEPRTQSTSRYRWWRDPRWMILVAVAASAGVVLWGLFGPEPRLIVSRETTYITEPLCPDGTPDYPAHVLGFLGRGTPPDENAAVALLHATWPMGLDSEELTEVCQELGVPDTPPDASPIEDAYKDKTLSSELQGFLALPTAGASALMVPDEDSKSRLLDIIDNTREFPWTAAECPPLANWIQRHSAALDLVVEGANRPTYALAWPDLVRGQSGTMLIGIEMPDLIVVRDASRELMARAMLHLGEGRVEDAWKDIHAVHRLARLIAPGDQPRFLITHLVAAALDATANAATITLLDSPLLAGNLAASIRCDLESLAALPDLVSSRVLERLGVLDTVVAIARMSRAERATLRLSMAADEMTWLYGTSLDMNAVLRVINVHADRVEAALSLPSHQARVRALDEIAAARTVAPCGPGSWEKLMWHVQLALNRGARSNAFGRELLGLLTSANVQVLGSYQRFRAAAAVIRMAAALAEYRARGLGGEAKPYPDTLAELVPEVLDAVPSDPCSGMEFRYERRGDGYLLYSIGTDGVDDGGTNHDLEKGEWRSREDDSDDMHKDIAIRLPQPKQSLIPPASDAGK